jgi:peptidoglycan/xylan/chitin deacetylase (PgdA/CDA1 family)
VRRRFLALALGAAVVAAPALTAMSASAADPLISQGRPVTASSDGGSGYVATNAVDGNTATRWASKSKIDPQWIRVDLGSTKKISKVSLVWDLSCATSYRIEVSTTGSTYTKAFSTTTGKGGTENITVSASGRYVRMFGTARCRSTFGYSLQEFKVYGSGGTTPSPSPSPSPTTGGDPYHAIPSDMGLLRVKTSRKLVAITIDDGPTFSGSSPTTKFLDVLKGRKAHATFFLIGGNAQPVPEVVRRELAEGNEVANHTWTHPHLPDLSSSEVKSELTKTQTELKSATGVTPHIMRPPYGESNKTLNKQIRGLGLVPIIWDVDTNDWMMPGVQSIVDAAVKPATAGSIILMHDGGGDRSQTLAALPKIIDGLRAKGLEPVTLDELMASGTPQTIEACCP